MHFIAIILSFFILDMTFPVQSENVQLNCDCNIINDTIYVNNSLDSGQGSLRCAIDCANINEDQNILVFDIPSSNEVVILLESPLPTLDGNIILDTEAQWIKIDGNSMSNEGDHGLRINGPNILISGLILENFPNNAIDNYQGFADITIENNTLRNNGRLSEFGDGIDFRLASQCSILKNKIIGSNKDGIYLQSCSDITIQSNEIIQNNKNGINIYRGDNILLGDSCNNCQNIISGNQENGINIVDASSHLFIFNNIIGLDNNGQLPIPNGNDGIHISASDSISIGEPGKSNMISGNGGNGIYVTDSSTHISIQSNKIGYSIYEGAGIPNAWSGIQIDRSQHIQIGGANINLGNRIGFHPNNVYISDSSVYCSIRHNEFSCALNAIFIAEGSNMNVPASNTIEIQDAFTVIGVEEPGTEIQLYLKDPNCTSCQGSLFLKSVFTYTGTWTIDLDEPLKNGDIISVVKTDVDGNSTAFSKCVELICEEDEVNIIPEDKEYICDGGELLLGVDNGQKFLWSTGEKSEEIIIFEGGPYMVTIINEMGCPAYDSIFIETKDSPELILPGQDTSYFCEESTLIKAEGSGDFIWNNGMTGPVLEVINSGTYCVSLTNFYDCTVSECITMIKGEPVEAELEVLGPSVFCNGESVELVASGGSNFQWSTGEINQDTIRVFQSGVYSVTVSNESGCVDSISHEITVNPSVSANIDPDGFVSICHGDSILLEASGGNSYLWGNGSTSSSLMVDELGNYFVTVSNEYGCEDIVSQVVSVKPPIEASINPSGEIEFCSNDTLYLNIEGQAVDSVIWNNHILADSVLVQESGQYVAEIHYFGCRISDSVDIIVNQSPEPIIIEGPSWSNPDSVQQFYIINSLDEYEYIWGVYGGSILKGNSTDTITILWERDDLGMICAYAIDSNFCQSKSECKMVDLAPLKEKNVESFDIHIYPNPSNGNFLISNKNGALPKNFHIELIDVHGKKLESFQCGNETKFPLSLDLSSYPSGIYFISISGNGKTILVEKLILEQ